MWKDHYSSLLNTTKNTDDFSRNFDNFYVDKVNDLFTIYDIIEAIKDLKLGKSVGLDNISAEHIKFAGNKIYVLLYMIFNTMLIHGYLPESFMETVLVPIIKDKRESITDKDNYRPIALTSVFSKLFESTILYKYKYVFDTNCHQFGFKNKHGTDMASFVLKSIIDFYTSNSSPVYICYIDASKAFERVNLSKLIERELPLIIVRILYFW